MLSKSFKGVGRAWASLTHVWRAAAHLVAAISLEIVSIYAGVDAWFNTTMHPMHRLVVVAAAGIIGLIGSSEIYKYFKNVKLESK